MKKSDTLNIAIGIAGIAVMVLLSKKSKEDGGTGGGSGEVIIPGYPDQNSSVVPSPDTGFVPSSYLTDMIPKKGSPIGPYNSPGTLGLAANTFSSPTGPYNSPATGGLNPFVPKKASSSSPAPASSYSRDSGNSAGSSSSLHSRMGVK